MREDSPDPIRFGGIASVVADQLEALCGIEARAATLGHIQRGGITSSHDRILSSRYGYAEMELAMQGKFGSMVVLKGDEIKSVSLEDVIGQENKLVEPDGEMIQMARALGVSFGD